MSEHLLTMSHTKLFFSVPSFSRANPLLSVLFPSWKLVTHPGFFLIQLVTMSFCSARHLTHELLLLGFPPDFLLTPSDLLLSPAQCSVPPAGEALAPLSLPVASSCCNFRRADIVVQGSVPLSIGLCVCWPLRFIRVPRVQMSIQTLSLEPLVDWSQI